MAHDTFPADYWTALSGAPAWVAADPRNLVDASQRLVEACWESIKAADESMGLWREQALRHAASISTEICH